MAALSLALLLAAPDTVARWQPLIAEAARHCAVPEDWIARVMHAESGGRTMLGGVPIRSPKGAIGLMQLMPLTWADMRGRLGLGSDPDDPRDNIVAGACYLRLMYERFGYPGLFAAYNAGPARYADWLSGERSLPAETIAYRAKVAGAPAVAVAPDPGLFAVRRPGVTGPAAPVQSLLFAISPRVP